MNPPTPELALTCGTFNAGVMLAGHLTIRISSALHHESFVHMSARGRRGPSGPPGYSPLSVVQLHISAVNAICIIKAQPSTASYKQPQLGTTLFNFCYVFSCCFLPFV